MTEPSYPEPPAEWTADAVLRDGTVVTIRLIEPADRAALNTFHETLSSRTVYLRFFSAHPHLTESDLAYFTEVDNQHRVALVAVAGAQIVGVGRFDVLDDVSAEVAFVVTDAMQGRGIGALLLTRLVDIARSLGVERFVAEVLPANRRMLETFRHSGLPVTERHSGDIVEVSFPLSR